MKKISKLGLISVLCLVLVIGGVFATWTYGTNKATSVTNLNNPMGLSLENISQTERGLLAVTAVPELTIDQADEDYNAELVITGNLVITFTADANSTNDILTNGIDLQISFSIPYGQYKNVDIITATTINVNRSTASNADNVFTYTITANELKNHLTLGNISLPTYDDYTDFNNNYLANKTITITVEDVTA